MYRRKSYTRADGTRVKGTTVRTSGSGRSRGRKTGGRYSHEKPWIKRKGKLGGSGFLSKSPSAQHKLLDKCVNKYGYRSCLGSVMVLSRNRSIEHKHSRKLNSLKEYLKKKYGGHGSFGKKSRKSRTNRTSRRMPRKRSRSRR